VIIGKNRLVEKYNTALSQQLKIKFQDFLGHFPGLFKGYFYKT